ncbi:MAG: oxidoreductase [Pseudonocardiales bacterium]|nr:oxidoreductase [Jatrophihabitantaceae bacterium]MCW2602226.1 oxidoreductase [Pseudonocardiales bacterium]
MGLFSRKQRGSTGGDGTLRGSSKEDVAHLEGFVATHRGVEAFVEPRTTVTETTLLLVAGDGEWTRRRINGPQGAWDFARKRSLPVYDVAIVGYPQRMRDWNARRKAAGESGRPGPSV